MSNTERKKILNYRTASGILPNPDNIDYGEIAIGYKKDSEAIYIKNNANDIVDFTPISIVNLTYSELKELRDNSKLKPSQYYRITDFVTTVANDTEAQSAGHPFDIIVLASDKNKLQDECYAIQHEGDEYFANCNLAAWKIWYCLDNDNTKYAWADTVNGKGVIYRMIDEWQNDCPYDFKNIMFSRTVTAGGLNIDGIYYTFSWVNEANKVEDASIVGQTLTNDKGTVNGVHDNLISASDAYSLGISNNTMALALNGNVFVSEYRYRKGFFLGIYGNHFATNCYNNTFGNKFNYNSFGNNCYNNTFGNDCVRNSFGNKCYDNTFGDGYYSNTFGNDCSSNTFGNNCSHNTFGNNCNSITFGTYCVRNSFGNYCLLNSFGNNCNYNTFGNYCYSNTFGNYFQYNAIGNDVDYIEIPTEKIYRTQILNGTKGEYSKHLTITFTPQTKYSQFAGLTSDGVLKIWVEADAPNDVVNITYTELKNLRDNSKLKPSQYYRITDFVTTVANDPEAQSAGHAFDIIVMASDKNKLQEECYAIQHKGDTYFANCNLAAWKIWYSLDNDTTKYTWADTTNGKGVIYRMIDEWQNDCPYDFKNIMFNRTVTAGDLNIDGAYYTFSWVNEAKEVEDASIVCQTLTDDEDAVPGVHDNLISASNVYRLRNGNVFVSEYSYADGFFYGIYGNHFATNCYNNTFGNWCNNNSFGNKCNSNTFGNGCDNNSFGNHCYSNTFGEYCSNNTFGNDCYSNTFGIRCGSNSFGNDCYSNIFKNDCKSNTFENECYRNTFGENCYNNTFGDSCNNNTFGYDCDSNTFGNDCDSNSFGKSCSSNTFGNNCDSNTFGDGCNNNTFGNDCGSNTFKNNCNSNTFENNCDSNTFGNECKYNSFGYNCSQNTFSNNCSSNSFGISCSSNSFGNGYSNNSFGYGCSSNSFGWGCISNTFGNYCDSNTFSNLFKFNAIGNDVRYIEIPTEEIYHTQILNGTKGTSKTNKLTIAFTTDTTYSQFAGLTSDGVLEIWVETDDSNGVDCGTY